MHEAFGRLGNTTNLLLQHKHLPFFLYPDMPAEEGGHYHLPLKWGDRLDAMHYPKAPLRALAQGVDLDINFDAIGSSTMSSHRLLLFAEQHGKAGELREALGQQYFVHGKRLASHAVLLAASESVGLDRGAVQALLDSDAFASEVHASIKAMSLQQIHSIPVFFIRSGNISRVVHGSASVDEFFQVFRAIELAGEE
jgi:predicted DsbA family dithiol-disulfide isomerase